MKRLLTHSQLKHTKQAANKFLTCFIATIMAVALSLPAAGIPTLSFADEPNQGSVTVTPADLEKGNSSSGSSNASGDTNLNKENNSSGDPKSALTAEGDSSDSSDDGSTSNDSTNDYSNREDAFNGRDGYTYIPGEGMIAPSPDLQPPVTDESGISTASINASDPAQMQVLVDNRFTGLNPANTTVNLYDYTSFKDANGNDEQYNSTNPDNWFNGANNINKDHALTFGNGMNNNMGYWNAGSGSGMGVFSGYTPGFQNIVSPVLGDDGYPMLSDGSMVVKGGGTEYVTTSTGDGWMTQSLTSWPEVGGYNSNPPLYSTAKRYGNSDFPLASWATPGTLLFSNAGGKNISDRVQNQWNNDRSLGYLFDTSAEASAAPGRTETHEDVKRSFSNR